ncbi:MAG TPA: Holliday junction resolvase RuvX, partial [candidate division Zixibacteria bacterium]|nr:Holliday junction resolvase RuvX [candidate division Zixibacteria bacterium]
IEVKSMDDAVKKVSLVIEEYNPNGIIIGYPILPSGDKSQKCLEVDEFVKKLAEIYKGEIHKVDESWSSQEATDIVHAHGKRSGKDKKRLDRLAAVIILQRFLNGER